MSQGFERSCMLQITISSERKVDILSQKSSVSAHIKNQQNFVNKTDVLFGKAATTL